MAPNTFRPGREYTIHGRLLNIPDKPVQVVAHIKSGTTTIAEEQVSLTDKNGNSIVLHSSHVN